MPKFFVIALFTAVALQGQQAIDLTHGCLPAAEAAQTPGMPTCFDKAEGQRMYERHVAGMRRVPVHVGQAVALLPAVDVQSPMVVTLARDASKCDMVSLQSVAGIPWDGSTILLGVEYTSPVQSVKNDKNGNPVATVSTVPGTHIIASLTLTPYGSYPLSNYFISKFVVKTECPSPWEADGAIATYRLLIVPPTNSGTGPTPPTTSSSVTVDNHGDPVAIVATSASMVSDNTVAIDGTDLSGDVYAFVNDVQMNISLTSPTRGVITGVPAGAIIQVAARGSTSVLSIK